MTKKEAIYKIKSVLDNLDQICSNKLKAEAVLNELQRLGLQPPSVKKLIKYKNNQTNQLLETIENVNEWED